MLSKLDEDINNYAPTASNEEKENLAKAARRPKLALVAEEHLDGPILIEIKNTLPTLRKAYKVFSRK